MKEISRTIKTAHVVALCANKDTAEMENRTYEFPVMKNEEKYLKAIQKKNTDSAIVPISICSIQIKEQMASAPLSKFMEIATISDLES